MVVEEELEVEVVVVVVLDSKQEGMVWGVRHDVVVVAAVMVVL